MISSQSLSAVRRKNRMSYFLAVFFMVCAGSGSVNAQLGDRHIQLFDFTYGIQPGTILGLSKDHQGFLWILSTRTVQRFDGNDINTFSFPQGLTNIYCDNKGRIWVNSSSAIYLFDVLSLDFRTIPIQTETAHFTLGSVFTVLDSLVWAITSKGFLEYDERNEVFREVERPISVAPPYKVATITTEGTCLYFAGTDQLYRVDLHSNRVDSLPQSDVYRIFPVSHDSILVSVWKIKSYWYDFGKKAITLCEIPKEMKVQKQMPFCVRSVAKISPNHFIMGSEDGLFLYLQYTGDFGEINLFYKGKPVYANDFSGSILLDEDDYVWFASIDGIGRFVLKGQSFGLMRNKQLYDNIAPGIDNVRQMTSGQPGHLWVATGNGFVHWDWEKNERKLFLPQYGSSTQLSFPSVRGIAWDGKYILLGPTDKGVLLFDPIAETYHHPTYTNNATREAAEKDFIDYLLLLRNGNTVILGRDHLYLMNGKTYEIVFVDLPMPNENTNSAFQDNDGLVWLTTNNGMYLLTENLELIQPVHFLTNSVLVRAGFIMKDGRLLFSTNDGVFTAQYDGKEIVVSKFSSYFDDLYVNILVEDHQGMIWAATDNGIYKYDPSSDRLNLFDYTDNVQGFGFNVNSWYLSSNGILFLGGANGINYFKPDGIQVLASSLNLFIQRVKGGRQDSTIFPLNKKAYLPWGQRSIDCQFVCPYFNNPKKLKFRYQLEGSGEDWKYIGNGNHIRFASLSPGDYTLHLEASINNADWIPSKNSFSFEVLYPFWLTWWFFVLVAFALVAMFWAFERNRNHRIAEKQEELDAQLAINYFSNQMMQNQSVEDMLWDVAKNCIGRLQFEDCVIYQLDESRRVLYQCAALGPKSPERYQIVNSLEIPLGKGISGHVALTGVGEIIDDTNLDPRYITDDIRRNSEICVPIASEGKVFGIIDCEHSKKGFFTQRHLSILTTIASLCAAKMVKAKAEAEKSETEQILMATKQQMADIEMQALRAQMNPHFIFNCLNSINRYIVKSDQATASLYLTRFAKLIRLILDNSNSKTVTLTNELEALRLYIDMETIRFEKQFSYSINIDEDVLPDHIYVPPLIIQPYVENAIWHGLLHKLTEGHLEIHISMPKPNMLECVVEDNGVGRAKAKELKSKSASSSKSLGMKLTESRLALLNKHSNWDASVTILDLVDPEGLPAGTRVTLRILIDG